MSFITKRERVFNEYDLFDLPARNEGKLKAFGSCTDARAWSHFGTDKTEHLVDIIKRNNDICKPKYVPTDVIVNTLMGVKNSEISRLKRKICAFEQMLSAYDQLDLTPEQKVEIANAHDAIKSANKELDDLFLDLDLTGFTEGIDSEGFETGKSGGDMSEMSRGDEPEKVRGNEWLCIEKCEVPQKQMKSNQFGESCNSDVATYITDPRIDEYQEVLIVKDAKLNAMQNTIAVMENDICEPYCLYAYIYTALEKIFAILSQNTEYKTYLELLCVDYRSTGSIDIKGKILYKLKVLEKFCGALMAPCSRNKTIHTEQDCACYHAEVSSHVETAYALTTSDVAQPNVLDCKRAQLIADIMDSDGMKDIYSKTSFKTNEEPGDECFIVEHYNIEQENIKRLKSLQISYDELMVCYENLKQEKDGIQQRCKDYELLEAQVQKLQHMLNEYSIFKRRSEDLDSLKEQFIVLSEETLNLEGQLKAEFEINNMKANKINELTNQNLNFENRINDITIAFEKEKNTFECKLKEAECKIMCHEQQIKMLSIQIDKLVQQDNMSDQDTPEKIFLLNEIEALKEKVNNCNVIIFCNEDEKRQLQSQFEEKLALMNKLKMEIEDWKGNYKSVFEHNEHLEKFAEESKGQIKQLLQINKKLNDDVDQKSSAVDNLINIINNKAEETNKLLDECERSKAENNILEEKLNDFKIFYSNDIKSLQSEKETALESLQLAKEKSEHLLQKVQSYDIEKNELKEIKDSILVQKIDCEKLKNMLTDIRHQNKQLSKDLEESHKREGTLLENLENLKAINNSSTEKIQSLEISRKQYITKINEADNKSRMLENKLSEHEIASKQLYSLQKSNDSLALERKMLEERLREKTLELHNTKESLDISRKESNELLKNSEHNLLSLNESYYKCLNDNKIIENELSNKNLELEHMKKSCKLIKLENINLKKEIENLKTLNDNNIKNNKLLQNKCKDNEQINKSLNKVSNENSDLQNKLQLLGKEHQELKKNLLGLQNENLSTQESVILIKGESEELKDKLQKICNLENEFEKLKFDYDSIKLQKDQLQKEYETQMQDLEHLKKDCQVLDEQSKGLLSYNELLEKALITTRNELLAQNDAPTGEALSKLFEEVNQMKEEKIYKQNKIRELLDKMDKYDQVINDLRNEILEKDANISVLENHINELEEEIKHLHEHLAAALNASEQMKDYSLQKIDESVKNVEIYHSEATSKLKHEIDKLQNANQLLEEKLCNLMEKNQETNQDKTKYISQLIQLKNERDVFLQQVQNLEALSVGGSALSSDNCNVNDILHSFDRIRKSLDINNTKSYSLEQKVSNYQTSLQLLQTKADEAKKIIEKEKQKIINEKEEAIKDRMNMGNQLNNLKEKLEEQNSHDRKTITDLQAELLNQKLIITNMNKSNQDLVSKLKSELREIQDLYKKATDNSNELKNQILQLSKENLKNMSIVENANIKLKEKAQEINILHLQLDVLKESKIVTYLTKQCQTTDYTVSDFYAQANVPVSTVKNNQEKMYTMKNNEVLRNKDNTHTLPNELQILTANTEPSHDFVQNSYRNHKLKQLSLGPLKQDSISDYDSQNPKTNTNSSKILLSNEHSINEPNANRPLHSKSELGFNDNKTDYETKQLISTKSTLNLNGEFSKTSSSNPNYSVDKNNYKDMLLIYDESKSTFDKPENNNLENVEKRDEIEKIVNKDLFENTKNIMHANVQQKQKLSAQLTKANNGFTTPSPDKRTKSSDSFSQRSNLSTKHYSRSEENINQNYITLNSLQRKTSIVDYAEQIKKDLSTSNPKTEKNRKHLNEIYPTGQYSIEIQSNTKSSSLCLSRMEDNLINVTHDQHDHVYSISNTYNVERTRTDTTNLKNNKQHSNGSLEQITKEVKDEVLIKNKALELNSNTRKKYSDKSVETILDNSLNIYEDKIRHLSNSLEFVKNDYKKKIKAIKLQYDSHIQNIIGEHNQGVQSLQSLHEDTLKDIIKTHENEVDNLRTLSIEAMKKADKSEKENIFLKNQMNNEANIKEITKEPVKLSARSSKKRKAIPHSDMKNLTKTNVQAINVQAKPRNVEPCTCTVDVSLSNTIRNIFEQVDVQQRKTVENNYIKYIADKVTKKNIDALDLQEISYLHVKVCRSWKQKLMKEEELQKKINTLETELINRQRNTHQNMENFDRMVQEEKKRLQVVRDAVFRAPEQNLTDDCSEVPELNLPDLTPARSNFSPDRITACHCMLEPVAGELRSAGDLMDPALLTVQQPRSKVNNFARRAVLVKPDGEVRPRRKYIEDPPTKLKRQDRNLGPKGNKKKE